MVVGECVAVGAVVGCIVGAFVDKSKDEPGKFIHFDNGWLRRLGMLLCAMIDASRVTLTVQSAQMAAYARDEMPRACHKKIIKKLDVHEAVLRKHTRGQ